MTSTPPLPVSEGTVLVRLPAHGRGWVDTLPPVPDGTSLTVTVGHPDLLPVADDALARAGYRVVGVASEHRPIGLAVDVLVPASVRASEPQWWLDVLARADRVFDLRMGPVQHVLAAELAMHARALAG